MNQGGYSPLLSHLRNPGCGWVGCQRTIEIFFRYRESKKHLALLQQEAAAVAALKIERFIPDIETAMKRPRRERCGAGFQI